VPLQDGDLYRQRCEDRYRLDEEELWRKESSSEGCEQEGLEREGEYHMHLYAVGGWRN